MSVLADFVTALRESGVTVYLGPPGNVLEPPAVVLTPGGPDWLAPETYMGQREALRAAACVPAVELDRVIWDLDAPGESGPLRRLSLQIVDAAASTGVLWTGAAAPVLTEIQGVSFLTATHRMSIPLEGGEETP